MMTSGRSCPFGDKLRKARREIGDLTRLAKISLSDRIYYL